MSSKINKTLILLLLVFTLVLVAVLGFNWGYDYIRAQDLRLDTMQELSQEKGGALVNETTPGAIKIYIPHSADTNDISKILEEQDVISNSVLFKVISKFNGFDGNYQAGTHYVLRDMSYDELMYVLTRRPDPVTITFVEGESYRTMKQKMLDAGMTFNEARMDEMVRYPNAFLDYDFVRMLVSNPDREWLLQGYLWPDTYSFDPNLDEESILRMFLDNTERKLSESQYIDRCKRMNLSLDQAMTIASIVQREAGGANSEEMSKVGKVFLNRIQQSMPLESCATINYLRGELGEDPVLWVRNSDLERFRGNPYNTYSQAGLPPGPINNPGTLAIEGILWPANEDYWPGASSYLFFCAKGDGTNVFANTLEEHNANNEYYSSQWEAQQNGTASTEAGAETETQPSP